MMSLTSSVMTMTSSTTAFPASAVCSRTQGAANTKVAPAGMQVVMMVVAFTPRSTNFAAVSKASLAMGSAFCATAVVQEITLLPVQTGNVTLT